MSSIELMHSMVKAEMQNVFDSALEEISRTTILTNSLSDGIEREVRQDTWRLYQLNERPLLYNQSRMLQIRLRALKSTMLTLQNSVNDVFDIVASPEEASELVDQESGMAAFHECINDSGLTLRQLRESFATVTAVDVDENALSDFDQVLFTTIAALRSPR